MSLEVKQVIEIAREQFIQLLPELALEIGGHPSSKRMLPPPPRPKRVDIRLEELEKERGNWAVTLNVPNPDFNPGALLEGIRTA